MNAFLWSLYSHKIIFECGEKETPNSKYLLKLIKRRSKALNFYQ